MGIKYCTEVNPIAVYEQSMNHISLQSHPLCVSCCVQVLSLTAVDGDLGTNAELTYVGVMSVPAIPFNVNGKCLASFRTLLMYTIGRSQNANGSSLTPSLHVVRSLGTRW